MAYKLIMVGRYLRRYSNTLHSSIWMSPTFLVAPSIWHLVFSGLFLRSLWFLLALAECGILIFSDGYPLLFRSVRSVFFVVLSKWDCWAGGCVCVDMSVEEKVSSSCGFQHIWQAGRVFFFLCGQEHCVFHFSPDFGQRMG